MNIFKYEFKTYIKSIIIWSISMSLLLLIFMAFYPTFSKDVALVETILENYPEEMLKAFGMSTGLPLSSVLGFLAFVFSFLQLIIAIQSANYGFSFLSIEEREFTADYLMTKPVSRQSILMSKFLAAFLSLLITDLFLVITTFLVLELFKNANDYEVKNVIVLLLSVPIFQLVFMSMGMFISVLVKKIRNVLSFSLSLAFVLYIINAMKAVFGGELLGYFSPFYHFEVGYILAEGKYDYKMVILSLILIIISLVSTFVLYTKRDIHSL